MILNDVYLFKLNLYAIFTYIYLNMYYKYTSLMIALIINNYK